MQQGPPLKFSVVLAVTGLLVAAALCSGCSTAGGALSNPVENNDQNLFVSTCETSIGRGVDVCRFVEGSKIAASLKIYLPKADRHEIRIRFQDKVTTFNAKGETFEFLWKDVVGADVWDRRFDGPTQIMVSSFRGEQKIRSLGHAFIIVLQKGYNPQPINGKPDTIQYCQLKFINDATQWECF